VLLRQVTRYPWEGQVTISIEMENPASFSLLLRKPGWCGSMQIAINGEAVDWRAHWESGYVRLERQWQPGDQVQIELAMPVERIYANPNVRQDMGYIALQRGPLVYCLEQVDNSAPLHHIILPSTSPFSTKFEPGLLGGVTVITSWAIAVNTVSWEGCLYSSNMYSYEACDLIAIPYYAWDNRQPGRMRIWFPERNWLTVDLDAF